MFTLIPLDQVAPGAVETLLDAAFGSDRHARTAYRLRDGTRPFDVLSWAAIQDAQLVGSIQCWPVAHLGDDGSRTPLILVGPIAVSPDRQHIGIGRALTRHVIERAVGMTGGDALMLIGDPDYYGRFFGFTAAATGQWRLPGPFDPARLLTLGDGAPARPGAIVADPARSE